MATLAPTADGIAADLREECAAMAQFVDLLQEEQECLLRGNADAVGPLIARKSVWLQKLAGFAERRRAFLRSRHCETDSRGMESWLTTAPEAAALGNDWQELLALTRLASRANEANGTLIATRLHSNQQSLAALAAAARNGNLYGKDGQAVGLWGSRQFGAA